MPFIIEKRCMECGTSYIGRPDKKFCSDQCRSTFNNRLKRDEVNCIRNINNTLRRNRRILKDLNPSGKVRVPTGLLRDKGFDFRHFTGMRKNSNGRQYYYCYDHGYTKISAGSYLLVMRKEFNV